MVHRRNCNPVFRLSTVTQLAAAGKVQWGGRKAAAQARELGYDIYQVTKIVSELKDKDFYGVYVPDSSNIPIQMDVYKLKTVSPAGQIDPIYLKIEIVGEELSVQEVSVNSFHLDT